MQQDRGRSFWNHPKCLTQTHWDTMFHGLQGFLLCLFLHPGPFLGNWPLAPFDLLLHSIFPGEMFPPKDFKFVPKGSHTESLATWGSVFLQVGVPWKKSQVPSKIAEVWSQSPGFSMLIHPQLMLLEAQGRLAAHPVLQGPDEAVISPSTLH